MKQMCLARIGLANLFVFAREISWQLEMTFLVQVFLKRQVERARNMPRHLVQWLSLAEIAGSCPDINQ